MLLPMPLRAHLVRCLSGLFTKKKREKRREEKRREEGKGISRGIYGCLGLKWFVDYYIIILIPV